jgi:hypothetical protein
MNNQKFYWWCVTFLLLNIPSMGMAQEQHGRDLRTYIDGGYYELNIIKRGTDEFYKTQEKVREFVWEHWQRKQKARISVRDCAMNYEGCDDAALFIFYIEPDINGSWQVSEESDFIHKAFPPFTTEDEHRKGVTIYRKVEKLTAPDDPTAPRDLGCGESLGDTWVFQIGTYKLRLTASSQNNDRSSKRCMIL